MTMHKVFQPRDNKHRLSVTRRRKKVRQHLGLHGWSNLRTRRIYRQEQRGIDDSNTNGTSGNPREFKEVLLTKGKINRF